VLVKPLKDAEIRRQMETAGYEVVGDGPGEYAKFLKEEIQHWAKVAKAAGIKPE
jgi:tripartite-type tricarboxylate transporter receptor subunit TctC